MSKIVEVIAEPNKMYVGATFKVKVKVQDTFISKKYLISEEEQTILSEDNQKIKTEWSE